VQRAKLVPASAVAALAEGGAGFAGFAAWLHLTPADPDVLALPDPSSLMVLPWQRDVAWVATDLVVEGTPLEQAPRRVLQQQLKRAEALGFEFRSGVEAEFFLLDPEQGPHRGSAAIGRDQQPGGDLELILVLVLFQGRMDALGAGLHTHGAHRAELDDSGVPELRLNRVFQHTGHHDMAERIDTAIGGMQTRLAEMTTIGHMDVPDGHGLRRRAFPHAQRFQ
jgi:glutamine synthetase